MKKAIIVGASSGIGREVARCLISKGWRVGLMARRIEPLEELRNMACERVCVISCDINSSQAETCLLSLIEKVRGVDLYFHAAGVGKQNITLEPHIEEHTLTTNVMGFSRFVGTAFRFMASHGGGHISVISSIAGVKGLAPAPAYSASKGFQNIYIQALEQLAYSHHLPIFFTDIRPGFVDTPLIADSQFPMKLSAPFVANKIVKAIEQRRHVVVIDWRYRLLVFLWRMLPNCIWRRLSLGARKR